MCLPTVKLSAKRPKKQHIVVAYPLTEAFFRAEGEPLSKSALLRLSLLFRPLRRERALLCSAPHLVAAFCRRHRRIVLRVDANRRAQYNKCISSARQAGSLVQRRPSGGNAIEVVPQQMQRGEG